SAGPPLPGKKPAFSSKPSTEPLSLQLTQPQDPLLMTTGTKPEGGNVLSDIDFMLQGLTDELDAMLENEIS
ncbi:unnamed protein product, partial [Candidula unifasciata]